PLTGARRPPEADLASPSLADLSGGRDVVLVLDRASPEQDLPVILAGVEREMRRNRDELRALQSKDPVELREAHVVADGQPERPVLGVDHDRLVTGLLGLG